ncbi:glycosyltransferase [uncultured Neptuniibacter sp.]|uniref:glycosyltransferase n=1 Tax=uncultured Neptuniibacter sp. TaxID=502143 RepID=UPI002629B3C5|nr:glycosyltransferase [uncultured Neptuniibacter sp.]
MLSVLVIGYVWPEPNSSAAGSHMLSLLRLFRAQNWQVTFASPAQKTEHMTDLANEGIESQNIALNDSSFDRFITELTPDIVMFDRFMMEEQFGWRVEKNCPDALRILDTEDLQCLRHARHQAVKQNREVELSDLFSDLAKREIAAIFRSDLSLIISSYEMSLLQQQFALPSTLIYHLPFMLDLPSLPVDQPSFEQRKHMVMIGNFRHAPNWDSVLQMQRLWPSIKQQLKAMGEEDVELHIYGAYPPPKATALHNPKTGFQIKGWADSAYDVLKNARLCLSPLRFGAGIKGKLLDAMVCKTPSITSPIGAEGMSPDHEWPGEIAESDEAFIELTASLYCDPDRWHAKQALASPILSHYYDGEKNGNTLVEHILQLRARLSEHRLNNFTGAMLCHHTMKSTQYMSQWIEAKNKLPPQT